MIPWRIAAFPGGGIKGYASALWLEALEERLGVPIGERIGLAAGTSTGSILACAVGAKIPAVRISTLYREHGPRIFPAGLEWFFGRMRRSLRLGLSAPLYDAEPLAAALQAEFGEDARLSDLPVKTLVTAYLASTQNPGLQVMKSWRPAAMVPRTWEAILGSCAAPGYFPAVGNGLVDGGLAANDPSVCAIAEALRLVPGASPRELALISVSAGRHPDPIEAAKLRGWGFAQWAPSILSRVFHGQESATAYAVDQLIPPEKRVRVVIHLENGALDDASTENLDAMRRAVVRHLDSQEGENEMRRALSLLE